MNNINFEAIEKAWFKPKKDTIKVNLDLKGVKNLENYITDLEQSRHVLDELEEYIEDRISILTISVDNKVKDQYFNNKCIGGVQELKHIKKTIRELKKEMK